MSRPLLGTLFGLACVSILFLFSATANAIPIHHHYTVVKRVGTTNRGAPLMVSKERTYVVNVAPRDSDDDGCPNTQDSYNGPGCKAPPTPTVAPQSSSSIAPTAPAAPSVTPASTGGCPSYMAGEASSPSAVNPSSGASGCYQVLPSTAAAMGPACSDVNASSCIAAICASAGNAAWASSGSTPCDYLKP